MLADLRKNLTSVFAKDNPLIQRREQYLTDYLNVPSQTAASLLPQNLPTVAGSPLNLSPTQQSAITSARSNAALAPLASINQLITGEYGTLSDILANAALLYQSQVGAAKSKAEGLRDLYSTGISEYSAKKPSGGGFDLTSLLQALGGNGEVQEPKLEDFREKEVEEIFGREGLSYDPPSQLSFGGGPPVTQGLSYSSQPSRGLLGDWLQSRQAGKRGLLGNILSPS